MAARQTILVLRGILSWIISTHIKLYLLSTCRFYLTSKVQHDVCAFSFLQQIVITGSQLLTLYLLWRWILIYAFHHKTWFYVLHILLLQLVKYYVSQKWAFGSYQTNISYRIVWTLTGLLISSFVSAMFILTLIPQYLFTIPFSSLTLNFACWWVHISKHLGITSP